MPFDKETFLRRLGKWLTKLRKSRGIPQDRLTEEAGLAKGTLSRIENGEVDPRATTLAKIAQAINVPASVTLDIPSSIE